MRLQFRKGLIAERGKGQMGQRANGDLALFDRAGYTEQNAGIAKW